jgi:hypothetical protein
VLQHQLVVASRLSPQTRQLELTWYNKMIEKVLRTFNVADLAQRLRCSPAYVKRCSAPFSPTGESLSVKRCNAVETNYVSLITDDIRSLHV